MKIGENESIQVYLNCEETDVKIDTDKFSEVLYSRKWENGTLGKNGILIMKI